MYEIEKLVPKDATQLYKLMWQFEKWLRLMVYVELRARNNKWEDAIKKHATDWPPRGIEGDKKLSHMTTIHQSTISYVSLGELWNVISDAINWKLFEKFFHRKIILMRVLKRLKIYEIE